MIDSTSWSTSNRFSSCCQGEKLKEMLKEFSYDILSYLATYKITFKLKETWKY